MDYSTQTSTTPARRGQKWTHEEEEVVLLGIENDRELTDIAIELGRTPKAIQLRLQTIARTMMSQGIDENTIFIKTRYTFGTELAIGGDDSTTTMTTPTTTTTPTASDVRELIREMRNLSGLLIQYMRLKGVTPVVQQQSSPPTPLQRLLRQPAEIVQEIVPAVEASAAVESAAPPPARQDGEPRRPRTAYIPKTYSPPITTLNHTTQ